MAKSIRLLSANLSGIQGPASATAPDTNKCRISLAGAGQWVTCAELESEMYPGAFFG